MARSIFIRRKREHSRAPIFSYIGLSFFLLMAIFGPWIAPYSPTDIVGGAWDPASAHQWLGTDNLGRDLLSRLIWGGRISIGVTFMATLLAFLLGVSLGFMAGLHQGLLDQILSRSNEILMAIPTLIFALLVLALLPKSIPIIIVVLGVLESTRVFRVARAIALDISGREFMESARLRGDSMLWILTREILPNGFMTLVSEFGVRFIFVLLFLSSLSFLGMGIQPPIADWGGMVRDNKEGVLFGVWAALIPGATIALLSICLNNSIDSLLKRHQRRW